ncbi:hypothetical protein BU17DRAFT_71189 [Hysterangium stoloniferum]|nr:hypothetical protein BU17DRAFT_71189 [Hysterangium stoloniferum]
MKKALRLLCLLCLSFKRMMHIPDPIDDETSDANPEVPSKRKNSGKRKEAKGVEKLIPIMPAILAIPPIIHFRVPFMLSGTKVHEIINIKANIPYEDVIKSIFGVGTLVDCWPKKWPSVFVQLSMDKKTAYPFGNQANWDTLVKIYPAEIAKKGENVLCILLVFYLLSPPKAEIAKMACEIRHKKARRSQGATVTKRDGHKARRSQSATVTRRDGHKARQSQGATVTRRDGHKARRSHSVTVTRRDDHKGARMTYTKGAGIDYIIIKQAIPPLSGLLDF